MKEIKKFNEYIKETIDINYGLIVLNREDLENGIYEILHFVGYTQEPNSADIKSLVNELKTDETFGLTKLGKNMLIISASEETVKEYKEIVNNDGLRLNEGKAEDVEHIGGSLKYRGETFSQFNSPKRYEGLKKYRFRVLAHEIDKVKIINFGKTDETKKTFSKLSKKYWENTLK